nr:unnamed protein product [Callosobruchus analis]
MMNLSWFSNILIHHPYFVLAAVSVFSCTCMVIPYTLKSVTFPSFQDPQLGFQTRGTIIANRLTTWANLVKSTRPSGEFTENPKPYLESIRKMQRQKLQSNKQKKNPKKGKMKKNRSKIPVYGNITTVQDKNTSKWVDIERWKSISKLEQLGTANGPPITDYLFCGSPDERYAHMVVISSSDSDLFTLQNLRDMCDIEFTLKNIYSYEDLCIQNTHYNRRCCMPWSLPNYVAILNKKDSCWNITAADVNNTKNILLECAPYFHNSELSSDCLKTRPTCNAPRICFEHDAVFNMLNYLSSTSFLPPNNTKNQWTPLKEAIIFLPLACSTTILPYYYQIESLDLTFGDTRIVAMDFGIKNSLFDAYLIYDIWLMGSGSLFVFICIWMYTKSLFLTIMTILVIIFSLGISYFMYVLVLEINFFPFMNLLATVVAIGIGSDDAFICCKIWAKTKTENDGILLPQLMSDTFQHAFVSMFVTAVTTSVAFLGSYISCITAVCCFSIFAGFAVVANYLLMITWFPASLVIWERSCLTQNSYVVSCFMLCYQTWCCTKARFKIPGSRFRNIAVQLWRAKEQWLLDIVLKFKYVWFTLLIIVALICSFVVLVYPGFQLPDSSEFQLFHMTHPFEQYDFIYKHRFWFRQPEKLEQSEYKLPLRFVWGVLPIDNGDHLDPSNLGTLIVDPTFDASLPESQEWLKNFCENLRQQPFYQSMLGPLLPNCFIETFMKSMERKCIDPFLQTNLTPCCEQSRFPFGKSVFDQCILDEIADIFKTPSSLLNSGMAGPKFSKDQNPTIKAVVVEYDSSYSYTMSYEQMEKFYTQVEEWMTRELEKAPSGMKNGWFISDLHFYDLQRELTHSTKITILLSMGLAFGVLLFSTFNVFISMYAIITITSCIFVTMALLVFMGWKLNILESTVVSTAIGLTVDFSLHYSVNYRLCPQDLSSCRLMATRYALSYMAGPAFMAALTTGAAGAFMIPSIVMPYVQIGTFLVLVMMISWVYATFLLGSMLAIMGPSGSCGEWNHGCNSLRCCWHWRWRIICCVGESQRMEEQEDEPRRMISMIQDTHELESLTYPRPATDKKDRTISTTTRKSQHTCEGYLLSQEGN